MVCLWSPARKSAYGLRQCQAAVWQFLRRTCPPRLLPEQAGIFRFPATRTAAALEPMQNCIRVPLGITLKKGTLMNNNMAQSKGLGAGAAILHGLAKNWWVLLLRGIAAVVFGILAFAWPGITIVSLIILYGAYALVDGLFALYAAISGGTGAAPRWWMAVVGIAGVLAGVIAFAWPGITALTILLLIGAWAIVSGIFEIIGAVRLRKEIDNEWTLILHGALSVIFGVLLMAMPGAGALAMVWVIGAYAIAAGILMIALAFRLRSHAR